MLSLAIGLCFSRCMSFPELLISKCWEFLAKIAIRVSLGEKKQLRISVSRKHAQKTPFFHTCVFPSTMVMRAGNTIAFPCHFGVFMRIHMCVPNCLWKHIPNVEIVEHRVYRCGNTFLTQYAFTITFLSLCGNTYVFTCSGSIKYLETHAVSTPSFSWSSSAAMPPGILMKIWKMYHKGRQKQLSQLTCLHFVFWYLLSNESNVLNLPI